MNTEGSAQAAFFNAWKAAAPPSFLICWRRRSGSLVDCPLSMIIIAVWRKYIEYEAIKGRAGHNRNYNFVSNWHSSGL
jgi:hypothetical protein